MPAVVNDLELPKASTGRWWNGHSEPELANQKLKLLLRTLKKLAGCRTVCHARRRLTREVSHAGPMMWPAKAEPGAPSGVGCTDLVRLYSPHPTKNMNKNINIGPLAII